jgi:putative hydrolase of the HAD superfamily
MPIRAILFDLGDTLYQLDPMEASVGHDLVRLLRQRTSLSAAQSESAAAALTERFLGAANGVNANDESDLRQADIAAEAIRLLSDQNIPFSRPVGEAITDLFTRADIARFRPAPDTATRLQPFRDRGLKLGIVSNTSSRPALLTAYLTKIGIATIVETIVYSSEVGWRKPDARIYRQALGALGLTASEALFVGDRVAADVLGPQAVGMQAVLTHEFRQEAPGTARPASVIAHLGELHSILDTLR